MSQDPNILATLGADTEPFERNLKKASAMLSAFGKKLRKGGNDLVKYGGAATAAGVVLTAALVTKQSAVIDSLAKTSDALGLTTRKLQALQHMSELNGIESERLNKTLKTMEVRLGEAARKGGLSADALSDVGINIKDIIDLSPDQQLTALADGFGRLENQSLKASVANDLFGRESIKMLKVLGALRKEGIEPTARELDQLGITVSRVDAAKVEAANDAIFRTKQVLGGVASSLTVELAPFIQQAADEFTNAAKASGGFGDEIRSAMETGLRLAGKLGNVIQGLRVVFKGIEVAAFGFGSAMMSAFELAATGVTSFADLHISAINKIIESLNKLPNVDIATIDPLGDSDFMKSVHDLGDTARNRVSVLMQELHNLAMQKMPADNIEEFLEKVKQKSQEAAEAVAKTISGEQESTGEAENVNKADDAKLEAIKSRFMTEQQLLRDHQAQMAVIGAEWNQANFETEDEWQDIREQAEKDHLEKLKKLRESKMTAVEKFNAKSWDSQVKQVSSSLVQMTAGVAQHSKKMFNLNKTAGIAEALINAYKGISLTMSSYPFPLNVGMAAAHAANAFQQVNAIKSQSFSGGGAGIAPSSSATAPTPVANVASTQAAAEPTRVLLEGVGLDDFVRVGTLVDRINKEMKNGAILQVA